jgi:hypothetical protein
MKQHRYSITSSERASSDGGTSRPSDLAVLRGGINHVVGNDARLIVMISDAA